MISLYYIKIDSVFSCMIVIYFIVTGLIIYLILFCVYVTNQNVFIQAPNFSVYCKQKCQKARGHPGLNQGPLDLQSNALPLSYIPTYR